MFRKTHNWILSWTSQIYFTLSHPISTAWRISVPYRRSLDVFRPKFCSNFPIFQCVVCSPFPTPAHSSWLNHPVNGRRWAKKKGMLGKCYIAWQSVHGLWLLLHNERYETIGSERIAESYRKPKKRNGDLLSLVCVPHTRSWCVAKGALLICNQTYS
jgi:hypothetical protein